MPVPPFVGRTRELAALGEAMEGVLKNRRPAIVALVGAPGSGRTRLMDKLWSRHNNEFSDIEQIRGFVARGDERRDAFRPLGRLLRGALQMDEAEDVETTRARVQETVARLSPPSLSEALAGLDFFLNLGLLPSSERPRGEEAGVVRRRAFAAFTWLIRQRALKAPQLILVERLGAATPEGLSLLAYLRDHLVDCPVMILCELDEKVPAREPAFFQRLGHAVLRVHPFGRDQTGEMMRAIAGRKVAPPDNLLDVVYEASGGLPERVRQGVARLVTEGIIPEGEGWGVQPDEALSIDFPLTEEEAAHHRLDQCEEAERRWLARAALIGEVFWAEALIPLARAEQGFDEVLSQWIELPSPNALRQVLDRLEEAKIIEPLGPERPAARYLFTDPAERAWLESQLDVEARALGHRVVAEWLESRMASSEEHALREMARHYGEGGNRHRAAFYYIQAGERARGRFAQDSAIEAYAAALEMLDPRDALPLMDVHHALGTLYTTVGRYVEAEASFRQMLIHAWVLDHKAKAGAALNRLGRLHREQARYDMALSLLEQARDLFHIADDGPGVASSLDDLGQVALRRGDRDTALDLFTEALDLRRRLKDPRSIAVSLTNLGRVQRDTGFLQVAEKTLREGLQIRLRIRDAVGVVTSHLALAELYHHWEDWPRAREAAEGALERAREVGDRGQTAKAMTLLGVVSTAEGKHDHAERLGRQAAALAEQLGDVRVAARARRSVALARRAAGDVEEARAVIEPAVLLCRRHKETYELAMCLHVSMLVFIDEAGADLGAAARYAAEAYDEQSVNLGGDASINRLIDEVLSEDDELPPQILALEPPRRQRLELAREAFQEALALCGELEAHLGQIRLIRSAEVLLAALGEVERARSLAAQREQLEATRQARAGQSA